MKQAASLKNLELGLLLPGIEINTSASDYFPIKQMQLSRFNGQHGELIGSVLSGAHRDRIEDWGPSQRLFPALAN